MNTEVIYKDNFRGLDNIKGVFTISLEVCMRIGIIVVFAVFVLLGAPSASYAYLDPGTGSMLLQGLIGGAVASAAFISVYWRKIINFFKNSKEMRDAKRKK